MMKKRKADEGEAPQPSLAASPRREFAVRKDAYHECVASLNRKFLAALERRLQDKKSGKDVNVSFRDLNTLYERKADKIHKQYSDIVASLSAAEPIAPEGARAAKKVSGLYMVGMNENGLLGLGEEITERLYPYPLAITDRNSSVRVVAVALGGMHSVALSDSGEVYTWGVNDQGALGREVPLDPDSPGQNMTGYEPGMVTLPRETKIVQVTAGDGHTAALTGDGRVFVWGTFLDTSGPFALTPSVKFGRSPMEIYSSPSLDEKVKRIASGTDHILALTAGGEVLSWGCGEKGRLGRVPEAEADAKVESRSQAALKQLLVPARVPGLNQVVTVAAGWYCSYAITRSGAVYAWGVNNYGQLALPRITSATVPPYYAPTHSPALSGRGVVAISSGEHHTLALISAGEVLSVGRATYGRLGRHGPGIDCNSDEPVAEPGVVGGFDSQVESVAAGGSVSGAVTAKGSVYLWGFNGNSQLARGTDENDVELPAKVARTKHFPGGGVVYVAFGGQHTAIMASDVVDPIQLDASVLKRQRGGTQ